MYRIIANILMIVPRVIIATGKELAAEVTPESVSEASGMLIDSYASDLASYATARNQVADMRHNNILVDQRLQELTRMNSLQAEAEKERSTYQELLDL